MQVRAAGTKSIGYKDKEFRSKTVSSKNAPKLLARVEELRLLSKAEEAGLLSAAEKAGLSLSSIEKMGLLSKAEDFGILTLATDTNAPALLTTVAVVCYALAPALVYFGPDDQFVAEAIGAALLALGGTAAFGGATLLGTLQKS